MKVSPPAGPSRRFPSLRSRHARARPVKSCRLGPASESGRAGPSPLPSQEGVGQGRAHFRVRPGRAGPRASESGTFRAAPPSRVRPGVSSLPGADSPQVESDVQRLGRGSSERSLAAL